MFQIQLFESKRKYSYVFGDGAIKNHTLYFDNMAKVFYAAKRGLLKHLKRTKWGLKV